MSPTNEQILSCNPFEGDFGGSGHGDRVLSDKVVTARNGGVCHTCSGSILPGTRVRRRAEVYDGKLMQFSWCAECCEAMPDDEAFEQRIMIGMSVRGTA